MISISSYLQSNMIAQLSEDQRIAAYCLRVTVEKASNALKKPIKELRDLLKKCELPELPDSFRGVAYPDLVKEKAVLECIDGMGFNKVGEKFCIPYSTLSTWVISYKRKNSLNVRKFADEKTQEKVAKKAYKHGEFKAVAKEQGRGYDAVWKWIKKYEKKHKLTASANNKRRKLDSDFLLEVAKEAIDKGLLATAEKYKLNARRVREWVYKYKDKHGIVYKRPTYTDKERQEAIKLAEKIGVKKAAKQLKISDYSIYLWIEKKAS